MTDAQQREAARQFFYRWNGKGREDEDARSYWIEILTNILGVERVTERVDFEKKVKGPDGNTKRIDVYIPETHVLIEQKSLNIPLDKPQAGHDGMTPYQQAKMYEDWLPHSEKAKWILSAHCQNMRSQRMWRSCSSILNQKNSFPVPRLMSFSFRKATAGIISLNRRLLAHFMSSCGRRCDIFEILLSQSVL